MTVAYRELLAKMDNTASVWIPNCYCIASSLGYSYCAAYSNDEFARERRLLCCSSN